MVGAAGRRLRITPGYVGEANTGEACARSRRLSLALGPPPSGQGPFRDALRFSRLCTRRAVDQTEGMRTSRRRKTAQTAIAIAPDAHATPVEDSAEPLFLVMIDWIPKFSAAPAASNKPLAPSTVSACPIMCRARSLQRNSTASAMSSTSAIRHEGIVRPSPLRAGPRVISIRPRSQDGHGRPRRPGCPSAPIPALSSG